MDRVRRTTTAVNRLTYTAPGQQSEVAGIFGMNPPQQQGTVGERPPSSQHPGVDTVEGVQYWMDFNNRLISMAERDLSSTNEEAARMEGKDQDSMSPQEWSDWQVLKTRRANAVIGIRQSKERLRDLNKKMEALKAHAENLSEPVGVPTRKSGSGSFVTTVSTIRRAEVDAESALMQLRHKFEDDAAEIDDQLELLQAELTNDPNNKDISSKISILEMQRKSLEKKHERKSRQIQERLAQNKEEILLEQEENAMENESRPPPPFLEKEVDTGMIPRDWSGFGFSMPKGPSAGNEWTQADRIDEMPQVSRLPPPTDGNTVSELVSAFKLVARELKGEKDWEPRELPVFTGQAEDWPIFKNEFHRTTPNGKINSSQNAIRLRKALKGSARDAVAGLLHEPENVTKILQVLEQRFGRKELVIETLIEKGEQCKSPEFNKPETLVAFGTTVQHLISTVKAMKEESYLNDKGLLNKLINKLPMIYSTNWIEWISAHPHLQENLASFGTWLESKVDINVRLYKPVIKDKEDSGSSKGRSTRGPVKMNAVTTEAKPPAEIRDDCAFCQLTNHRIGRCFKFRDKPLEEKLKFVKDKGLCFRCLGSGHTKKDCSSHVMCSHEGCNQTHHPLIHNERNAWKGKKARDSSGSSAAKEESPQKDSSSAPAVSNIGAVTTQQSKPISIVKIRVKGPKGIRKVFALLDSGCDTTVILKDLAAELGINGKVVANQCQVVGGKSFRVLCKQVEFQVAGTYKTARFYPIQEALTMDTVGLGSYTQNADEVKQRWSYLRKAKLDSFTAAKVQVIIGEDHPYVTAHRELLQRKSNEPMAKRTLLGWVLAGKVTSAKGNMNINAASFEEEEHLDNLLKLNFTLDSYGVYPKDTVGSLEDRRSLEILKNTVKRISDTQWECGLLWRDATVKLSPSREDAVSRLVSNERRMKRDPVYAKMYQAKIEEYLQKGYARKLTDAEARATTDKTLYIPHFGVYNVNKPGKLRLVFDAACRGGGVSLNQHLLTGPDLIRPLPSVLMNFRIHNIVITGDMEDMYHRVAVRKEDRDSQRFVWRNPNDNDRKVQDYVMEVLLFGSCSSQSSAIFVKDKNADQFVDRFPEAVRAIHADFYSDDCLSGARTPEDAILLRKQITDINAAGNFAVKKWLSNSKAVLSSIPEEDRAKGVKSFTDKTEIPAERVLGLWWKPDEDVFTFSANFQKIDPTLLEGRRPTKREMCSVLMSVFDPLGFIANFRIKGLILLQQTWKTGINWDDDITEEIYKEWRIWVGNLKDTENVHIPRWYVQDIHLASSIQLHTLVDASEEATTTICYLRVKIGEAVSVAFVSAKSKVAPLKKQTIPRLELIAAVMGACLADTVINELRVQIHGKFYWTDSRTVLKWIRTESLRYKEYVANRVNRIHLLSQVREWRWIPTDLNVADQGTRLHSKIELSPDSLWLRGPGFLLEEPSTWPVEQTVQVPEEDPEVRKSTIFATSMLADPLGVGASIDEARGLRGGKLGLTVKMERFSSFTRMIRAQCAVIAAGNYWISKARGIEAEKPWKLVHGKRTSVFPPEMMKMAELALIRKVQSEVFGEDITSLVKNGVLPNSSKLLRLSAFLEDGLLKAKGRIGEADVAEEIKTPILLPARHHFTNLLIMREHQRIAHQGQGTVLTNLRKRFWILEGRAAVRRAVNSCQLCKLGKAKPVLPKMGDLPYYRLAAGNPPFTYTGVDLMGPVEVVVGRHHEKRWIIVFTCMVTRAIHLDVVYGLSTDETMMALSRFIDQRGRPQHVYSDNGTNFVGAKGELRKNWNAVDWTAIINTDKFQEINWSFTPPCTPHFGGTWERMVREVKKILRKTLLEKYPKDQTLLTMIKGAENIINSRPLTALSSDPKDNEALTPNHFLRGFADVGPTVPGEYEKADELRRAHWRRCQQFVNQFWKRWRDEVLPELIHREKWHVNADPLVVGDLVLLVDDQATRNSWKKGVVTETFPGKDGQVRVVQVETADFGTKKRTQYKRGVEKVVPLGLRMENPDKPPDFGGRNVVAKRD